MNTDDFLTLLNEGGVVAYLLLALLLLSTAIFLERYLVYYRSQIDTHEFLRGIFNIIRNNKIVEAVAICDSKPYPVSSVVRAVITHIDEGETALRNAADEAAMTELPKLKRGVKLLACFGNLSPILGLLGTLLSLMQIFDKMNGSGYFVSTTALAGYVKSAIFTTALGLVVAMAAHLFTFILSEKLDKIITDMEKACVEMTNFLLVRKNQEQDDKREKPARADDDTKASKNEKQAQGKDRGTKE